MWELETNNRPAKVTGYLFKTLININKFAEIEVFYQIVHFFQLDMCCKPIICSKVVRKGKFCLRLLELQEVAPNNKCCSKGAKHNRDRPSWGEQRLLPHSWEILFVPYYWQLFALIYPNHESLFHLKWSKSPQWWLNSTIRPLPFKIPDCARFLNNFNWLKCEVVSIYRTAQAERIVAAKT